MRLTTKDVLDIVKRLKEGERPTDLAAFYKVAISTISKIKSGVLHSDITGIRRNLFGVR